MRLSLMALPILCLLTACQPPLGEVCGDPVFRHHAGLDPVDASPVNAEERAINQSIPSYAGTYPGEDGALIVALTADASEQDIERAREMGEARALEMGLERSEVQTTARYTFSELDGFWLESLDFIFAEDIRAHHVAPLFNGIVTGVADDAAAERIEALWEAKDLPSDLLHFEVGREYIHLLPTCPH